jgi:hypothetical protein
LKKLCFGWQRQFGLIFSAILKKSMINNKPGEDQKDQTGQPQNTQGKPVVNPFRNPAPPEENSTEIEAELEQQRKEALTERD